MRCNNYNHNNYDATITDASKKGSHTAKKTYNYSVMLKFKSHFMKNPDVIEKK